VDVEADCTVKMRSEERRFRCCRRQVRLIWALSTVDCRKMEGGAYRSSSTRNEWREGYKMEGALGRGLLPEACLFTAVFLSSMGSVHK
jgi:hypothetical protein